MNTRNAWIRFSQVLALALLLLTGSSMAQTTATSTDADQQELSITVYNSNIGLVRDVRRVQLPTGKIDLHFVGVPTEIQPATVRIASLTAAKQFSVLEQDYRYDLLSPQKLLQQYVGKNVTLVRQVTENNSTKEVQVQATLLAYNGAPVWEIGSQIVIGMPEIQYIFPSLPENLYSRPTMVWLVDNGFAGPQRIEADYLTNSINWNADYVLTLPSEGKSAGLNAWVTITNHSGATFRNARLQLVAGQLHRATEVPRPMGGRMAMIAAGGVVAAEAVVQEPLSEYHLYTLPQPATLLNNDAKQIQLQESTGIRFDRNYEVNGQSYYYYSPFQGGQPLKEPVQAHILFTNSEDNSLGAPLPAGVVRVYQADSKGQTQLIGEDRLGPTAKDEKVDLYIGNAFDEVAERKQTDFQTLGHDIYEVAFDITLRNHKDQPVTIEVNEPVGGDWTMLKSNYKAEKTSAFSARFRIPVPANGESMLSYRVRIHR